MTRLRFSLLVPLVVAAAFLGACGSGGGASDDSVDGILKQTFEAGKSISSGRVSLDLSADLKGAKGIDGPVGLKLSGPFQSDGARKLPKFDLNLTVRASGSSFTAGATSTGTQGFVKFGGTTYSVPANIFDLFKSGFEQAQSGTTSKKKGTTFDSLGIHPRTWLKDAKKAGSETVGGAQTTHISAAIDVSKFVDDLNEIVKKADSLGVTSGTKVQGITGIQKLELVRSVKSSAVDVYSGESDRILRRLKVRLDIDVPVEARSQIGGLSTGTITLDLLLADVNKNQSISAPAGETRPLSELLSRFGLSGLTAGSGSGGSSSSGSGSSTTTTPPAQGVSKKYLDCLQKAGSDLTKVQKCADLLAG
jgi:hypothetical protein